MKSCKLPISWLELELYALKESTQQDRIAMHLLECSACEDALASIAGDTRTMPALELSVAPPKARLHWRSLLASLGVVCAAAILWIAFATGDSKGGFEPKEVKRYGVKGETLELILIRERGGELLPPTHFNSADRFKVEVSCSPGREEILEEARFWVEQDSQTFYPLTVQRIACGNRVPLAGAFSLQGGPARLCIEAAKKRRCLSVSPE